MNTKTKILAAIVITSAAAMLAITGCALTTPIGQTVTPGENGNPAVTNQIYGIKPAVATAEETANAVTPFLPAPYNIAVAGLASLFSAGLGAFVAFRNRNAAVQDWKNVADTVIQGIESAGTAAAAVKQAVASKALANGTADSVHAAVQANSPT